MSEARDTTVLPCRHMCLCYACAKVGGWGEAKWSEGEGRGASARVATGWVAGWLAENWMTGWGTTDAGG